MASFNNTNNITGGITSNSNITTYSTTSSSSDIYITQSDGKEVSLVELVDRLQELELMCTAMASIINQHIDLGDTMTFDERIAAAKMINKLSK